MIFFYCSISCVVFSLLLTIDMVFFPCAIHFLSVFSIFAMDFQRNFEKHVKNVLKNKIKIEMNKEIWTICKMELEQSSRCSSVSNNNNRIMRVVIFNISISAHFHLFIQKKKPKIGAINGEKFAFSYSHSDHVDYKINFIFFYTFIGAVLFCYIHLMKL